MARSKPLIETTKAFVRYHLGKDCFAPLTGQDWPAWCAFVHIVECWCHGGGDDAIEAMRAVVRCAQPTGAVLRTFVQAVPAVGDWPHVAKLWPSIAGAIDGGGRLAEICAHERHVNYDSNHKIVGTRGFTLYGLNAPAAMQVAP